MTNLYSDPMTLTLNSTVQNGNGQLNLNQDGSFSYQPNVNYVGPDSFSYALTAGIYTLHGVVPLQVVNQAPVAQADSYQVQHDGSLNVSAAYL